MKSSPVWLVELLARNAEYALSRDTEEGTAGKLMALVVNTYQVQEKVTIKSCEHKQWNVQDREREEETHKQFVRETETIAEAQHYLGPSELKNNGVAKVLPEHCCCSSERCDSTIEDMLNLPRILRAGMATAHIAHTTQEEEKRGRMAVRK